VAENKPKRREMEILNRLLLFESLEKEILIGNNGRTASAYNGGDRRD
jgi:hypothetical protein